MKRVIGAAIALAALAGCTMDGRFITGDMLERAIGTAAVETVYAPRYGYQDFVRGPDGRTTVVTGSCNGGSCYSTVKPLK